MGRTCPARGFWLRYRTMSPPRDFYEIQKRQKVRSLLLFGGLLLFYFLAVGVVTVALVASVSLIRAGSLLTGRFLAQLLLFDLVFSALLAVIHFYDARKLGAAFILKRLQAQPPLPADRYHLTFLNTVEEMRIGSGLPRAAVYVIPSFAFNSMALVEADGTAAIAVTEGLLADATRDELQAVCAHGLAHIARGDAFYLTLVCSLVDFFERLLDDLTPERVEPAAGRSSLVAAEGAGSPPLPVPLYIAVALSGMVMAIIHGLISRERELLADAAAVEIGRSPEALARAIYKATLKNSFVGDFRASYAPLFIVAPGEDPTGSGRLQRLFDTHPPVSKRLEALAGMAGLTSGDIRARVAAQIQEREEKRSVLRSQEERQGRGRGTENGISSEKQGVVGAERWAGTDKLPPSEARIWLFRDRAGEWVGPLTMAELVCYPQLTTMALVRNTQEGVEAKAREFPQVRIALRTMAKRGSKAPVGDARCPRCRVPLRETFYEGVPLRDCPQCRGRLVDMGLVDRIVARRELAFSKDLKRKAVEFREGLLLNPLRKKKAAGPKAGGFACPACGWRMAARPYNYQDFIPVDKCLSCHRIWFDADELETLQILVEERTSARSSN